MVSSPETMPPGRRGAIASLRPRLSAPAGKRRLLLAAGAAFVATWSLGGFYQAFGPPVAAEYLGTSSPLVAAAIFSAVMILNPLGGPRTIRKKTPRALRAGMLLFALAIAGIVASLHAGMIWSFIAASLMVGAAQGVASTAGIQALLVGASADERAGLLATIYLISYCGAAIPGVIAGELARTLTLFPIALGYAALGLVAAGVAIIAVGERPDVKKGFGPDGGREAR